jgi:hypothetical protein
MSSLDHIDAPKAILVGRFHLSLLTRPLSLPV